MKTLTEYWNILSQKGFHYSLHETFKKVQRIHWVKDRSILDIIHQEKTYRYLGKKYGKFIKMNNLTNQPIVENRFPNKIWVCWLQGYDQAPLIVQRCIDSIRKNANGYEVILLTEANLHHYVSLPEYIQEKYKKGYISRTHYSDIIRVSLLADFGGIWADSTIFMTEPLPDYISQAPLFCYKARFSPQKIKASSWLISAEPANKIIVETRKVLYEYWKKNKFTLYYFCFHLFFALVIDLNPDNSKAWKQVPNFNNVNPHVLADELFDQFDQTRFDQICDYAPMHKLSYKAPECKSEMIQGTFYERLLLNKLYKS